MADQLAPAYGWLPLVAEHCRNASRDSGPCPVCQRLLARGQRIADLPQGATVHVSCAGKAETVAPAAITASNAPADDTPRRKHPQRHRTTRSEAE